MIIRSHSLLFLLLAFQFSVVEEMPRFPGCEEKETINLKKQCAGQKLLQYLYKRIRYPTPSPKEGIPSDPAFSFVIQKDGCINDIKILKGSSVQLNNSIVEIIAEMPSWTPGKHKNKTVDVKFHLPIRIHWE